MEEFATALTKQADVAKCGGARRERGDGVPMGDYLLGRESSALILAMMS